MDNERKKYIDNLWFNTKLYEWIVLSCNNEQKKAVAIVNDLFEKGYLRPIEQLEEEVCEKIASEIEGISEFEDYLKILDKDSPDIVEFILNHDVFDVVYNKFIE